MPEQLQQVFEVIKDYGAAMISTIAAGGLAGIASIIKSIKNSVNANKDEVKNLVNNEAKSTKEIKIIKGDYDYEEIDYIFDSVSVCIGIL